MVFASETAIEQTQSLFQDTFTHKSSQAAVLSESVLPPVDGVYGQSSGFGSSISVSGNKALIGGQGIYPSSSAYIFEYDGNQWIESIKLEPSDTTEITSYGSNVEFDGEWAFVSGEKKVYVFRFNGQEWEEIQILTPNFDHPRFFPETFGQSMSLNDNMILIGDSGYASPSDGSIGVVFAFKIENNQWVQKQVLFPEGDVNENDNFGFSLSLDGTHAVIGSYYDGNVHFYEYEEEQFVFKNKFSQQTFSFGNNVQISAELALITDNLLDAVYIYHYDGVNWAYESTLSVDDPENVNVFGNSAYFIGNKVYVTDPNQKIDDVNMSATYVFHYIDKEWVQEQKININESQISVVAISNDQLLISSPGVNHYGLGSGVIKHLKLQDSLWTFFDNITPKRGAARQKFGHQTEVTKEWLIVGAPYEYTFGNRSGAVFIYQKVGADWLFKQMISPSDPKLKAYFGHSISLQGDTLVVGAFNQDSANSETGAAYVFDFDGNEWLETQKITANDGMTGDFFGYSVKISDHQILIGSIGSDTFGNNSGSVYVYENTGSKWTEFQKFSSAKITADDLFGYAIDVNGDTALIGAPEKLNRTGAVFYFKYESGFWNEKPELNLSKPRRNLTFGKEIQINGDQAVIAAAPTGGPTAMIFKYENGQWVEQQSIEPPSFSPVFHFGQNVSISEENLLIKERDYNNTAYWYQYDGFVWNLKQTISIPENTEMRSVKIFEDKFYIGSNNNLFGSNSGVIDVFKLVDDTIFKHGFEFDSSKAIH